MTQSAPIPSGTVTLLFTDIQGSTRLWEAEPEPMAAALRRHDEILRTAIEGGGGYVFKTVGDAFCATFPTASAGVQAALSAQRELGTEAWPTSRPIRVRMGLHTGGCEERDGDYFGPVVNRAARLEAVAHGGQVLISGATAELLAGRANLRDLGQHRLKDLGRPEQVFQLEADFLEASFPPLASLDSPELPNNLPGLLSVFVGRERELAEVGDLVRSSRLVTLTGAGGSGKTRLAAQAAAELLGASADGVWLAELAPLADGADIPAVVASALGVPDAGRLPLDAVTEALTGQDALILLDNCEHVIDDAAKFCDHLIRHCQKVRILATSREPLGIDGERVYRVPSLSLPPKDAETADELMASDAVSLFADRARVHDPGFAIDASTAALVATICRRLDGIPLALELAAARLSAMSVRQVSERLDQRFRLLTGGARNAMPRQQTLQATVEWSFGMLTEAERQTLTRLSVFAGGFDLEAAEAVCATGEVDAFDVLDLVGSLVDKSLVIADHAADSVRYRLLETIRQYSAQELLRAAGDAEVLRARDRHAGYYLSLAEKAEPALTGRDQAPWLRRLDSEWDNIRAAFAHLEADERATDVLQLGVCLARLVISRGHAEVLPYLQRALDQRDLPPGPVVARGLLIASQLIWMFRLRVPEDHPIACQYAERGLAMARELGDKHTEVRALGVLAGAMYYQRDLGAAARLNEQGIELARSIGDLAALCDLLGILVAVASSDDERRRLALEALEICRQSGDDLTAVNVEHNLAALDLSAGRLMDARARLETGIALAEQTGAEVFLNLMRTDLGLLLLILGEPGQAAPLIKRCLLSAHRSGGGIENCDLLIGAACLTAWLGDQLRAARLHGAADAAITTALGMGSFRWSDAELALRQREQASLREQLGDAVYADAYRRGAELLPWQAVDLALGRELAH